MTENSKNREIEKKPAGEKKKLSKYEIFRRIMLSVFIVLFVCCLIQFITLIFKYIEARRVSEEVLEGAEQITKPVESSPLSTDPIQIEPETTPPPESSSPAESGEDTTPELEQPDHVYSEYFSQWLEYIRQSKKKYPDLVGYIEIENLDILYPILQSDDNSYYLDHLIDGSKNSRGEIFLDYRNNGESFLKNDNIILYGHNLADGTKFHNLTRLREEENYYSSPINIITEDGIFTFTIFSFYKTEKDTQYLRLNFESKQRYILYCLNEQSMSMYPSNYTFTGKEVILTLSTCVNDMGGRWCTHAVLTNISQ